jgi:hypothetical protein|tara:strand:- start:2517 stop:3368 length:852 start_codon:yes stop_codon:yes gene_type:complete
MSISSSAVLVRLSISTWTAKKIDKHQTENVYRREGADSKAGKYIKDIMVGCKHIGEVTKYANNTRNEYANRTLPWDDMGDRILSTSSLLPFKSDFNGKRDEFWRRRDYICNNYDNLKHISASYLGAMYNPSDYPSVDSVYEKYAWKLTIKTVPESGHLYLDLPAQDLEEMRQALEADNQDKTKHAMDTAWHRMHDMLSSMSAKLTEGEEDKKKRFYESFVSNPKDLCDMLEHLNIANDPELERARVMLERTIKGADIEVIKESPAIREDMKTKVDSILKQFDW